MPTTTSAAPKLLELTVSRTIDAAPAAVFDAWVDPAKVSAWFGAARVIMNPVVDGLYYIGVKHQGRNWPHYGRFLRIERPRLVEQTWMSESTHGLESIVTFSIAPQGRAGSEVTIHHTGLPDEKERRNHKDGWTSLLEALEQQLKTQK
ncbi:MAG TPA: SRPBCC domain-containing protein [Gemmatimonadales bacterium]|nr:SRPBCC domain-containing protein [Gemmatimonadales bacterium]